jgi:hypothetical protein
VKAGSIAVVAAGVVLVAGGVVAFEVQQHRAADEAGMQPVGMACSSATVDGSAIGFQEEQFFIARKVKPTLYRTPGMYFAVFPSTGAPDPQGAKPDQSWVPDNSKAAQTTCAIYFAKPSATPSK